jgi:hypothetical protein
LEQTPILMRHEYHIEDLGQPRGWFRAHRYRYSCIRCGWVFLVEGYRGITTALNELGGHLTEPEQSRRVETFGLGPCIPVPAQAHSEREQVNRMPAPGRVRVAARRRAAVVQVMAAK